MRLSIGSDHAGFKLRRSVAEHLRRTGHSIVDEYGPTQEGVKSDYPEAAVAVARDVSAGKVERGILVCGSGQGVCMAANKIPGIMAARCLSPKDALMTRQHNNANVLCLSEDCTEAPVALQIVDTFLSTDFTPGEGGRHARRVAQVLALLEKNK